jgi:adenine C2-methylase RlmN of 23S rRNA A2503 and tRNA A37
LYNPGVDPAKLRDFLDARKEPAYRLEQALDGVLRRGAPRFAAVTTLPPALAAALDEELGVLSFTEVESRVSADGTTRKAALRLRGGAVIETVLIRRGEGSGWTACLSTQAGCAFRCAFCATGRMGLRRSLGAEEICDQALYWRQRLRASSSGTLDRVVFMGMGEPLANYGAVAESLRRLMDPGLFSMAARHLSVSTVGVRGGIERFCSDFPQANLAFSLHAADDELRERLVPANRAFPLGDARKALEFAMEKTRRRAFLEWVLLAGVNDGRAQADDLVRFVRSFGKPHLLHVNLIAFNRIGSHFDAPSPEKSRAFLDRLRSRGLGATLRKSAGSDIRAACGQLAGPAPISRKA